MSQQDDNYAFLVERLRDLLADTYGFREHWDVRLTHDRFRSSVGTMITLSLNPDRNLYGDVSYAFETPQDIFSEHSIVRNSVLDCARHIIGSLRYGDWESSHPPQVKLYGWLQSRRQEVRERYVVQPSELPFSRSGSLQVLLIALLEYYLEERVTVSGFEARIGSPGERGEMMFRTPAALTAYIHEVARSRAARPAIAAKPQSHVRKVEL